MVPIIQKDCHLREGQCDKSEFIGLDEESQEADDLLVEKEKFK